MADGGLERNEIRSRKRNCKEGGRQQGGGHVGRRFGDICMFDVHGKEPKKEM